MGYLNTFLIKRAFGFDFDEFMTKEAATDYTTWNPQATSNVERMVMRSHGLNPAQARQYVQKAFIDKGFTPADVRGYTQRMHLEKNIRPKATPRPAAPAAKVLPKGMSVPAPHYVDQFFPLADSAAPVSPKPSVPKVTPKVTTSATPLPHYVDQHFPLADSSAPVSPKATPKVAPKVTPKASPMQLPHYVDQHFPLADGPAPANAPVSPKANAGAAGAPAPANAPVSPKPSAGTAAGAADDAAKAGAGAAANVADDAAKAGAGAADDAAKAALKSKGGPISYGRRMKAIMHRATHNPLRAGKQGWQLAKTFARRNPKLAILGLIGSSLAGGAMLGSAADSGTPPERKMSDANNPYAGFEQY